MFHHMLQPGARSLRSADGSLSFVLFVQEGPNRRSSGFTAIVVLDFGPSGRVLLYTAYNNDAGTPECGTLLFTGGEPLPLRQNSQSQPDNQNQVESAKLRFSAAVGNRGSCLYREIAAIDRQDRARDPGRLIARQIYGQTGNVLRSAESADGM